MLIEISQWGNSLGMRIPKPFAQALGISKNTRARLTLEKGKLIITPENSLAVFESLPQKMSLAALCKKMRPYNENLDAEPLETELWEYEE